jgi:uracil-DNA glycosylase family 4
MAKLNTLSLDELYAKEKKTVAVISAIIEKSDFSTINDRYCAEVCRINCKSPDQVALISGQVDILLIQDHKNPPGRYDRHPGQQDQVIDSIVDFVAQSAGFRKEGITYRLVSLLKCKADAVDFPLGKPPTQTTLQKCEPYLRSEIERCKPKVIISLGTATTKSLGLAKHSNTGNRGEVVFSEFGPVVITLHPRVLSYIRQNARGGNGMWGPDYFNIVKRDFKKALDVATGKIKFNRNTLQETVTKLAKERIFVAKSLADVRNICDQIEALPPEKIISFDTETTTVDPLDPNLKILTIQFGWMDPRTGVIVSGVIPLYHRKNTFYEADKAWEMLEPILMSQRPKVGHNSKFDILIIYWAKGIRVVNVCFDTLLLQHSIESGTQGCYGLKTACWDHLFHLGIAGYEDELGKLSDLKKSLEKQRLKDEPAEEEAAVEFD